MKILHKTSYEYHRIFKHKSLLLRFDAYIGEQTKIISLLELPLGRGW